ncbi:2'-5' RNA ligase [Krasilnikovia cinnamomea]|uniref:2'-5' RNA ligase n=1 Tax=Krasilnikovia cinnamomea TaxID=349313 RepID=A0A4Q7ZKH5_9ACTN|nr:2'-5' RNA ligase [Krasilnikovia cinnamomea]
MTAEAVAAEELRCFREIRQLRDHWAGGGGRRAYCWYLTFEGCTELRALAKRCRDRTALRYYDFTPPSELHMTLDRIAFEGEIPPDVLRAVASAATMACRGVPPLDINIGGLGGTPGAIGLSVFPRGPVQRLRDALRAATLSVSPSAQVKNSDFRPHVALAYCNSDVRAAHAIAAVERLSTVGAVAVTVKHVAVVLVERRQRAYSWNAITQIPLTGGA